MKVTTDVITDEAVTAAKLDLSGKTLTLPAANFGETEIYTVARFWKVA